MAAQFDIYGLVPVLFDTHWRSFHQYLIPVQQILHDLLFPLFVGYKEVRVIDNF